MRTVSENSGTTLNTPTSHIIGGPEEKRERRRQKKIFQEITAENFPKMGKESLTQFQEAQRVPYKINPRRNTQDTY